MTHAAMRAGFSHLIQSRLVLFPISSTKPLLLLTNVIDLDHVQSLHPDEGINRNPGVLQRVSNLIYCSDLR